MATCRRPHIVGVKCNKMLLIPCNPTNLRYCCRLNNNINEAEMEGKADSLQPETNEVHVLDVITRQTTRRLALTGRF